MPLIAALPLLALAAPAASPPVLIDNQGRQSIYNLYAVPEGKRGWGADRLEDATIPPGRSRSVTIAHPPGRCHYRVKLVLADRREVIRPVDLCRGGRWTVDGSGDRFEPEGSSAP